MFIWKVSEMRLFDKTFTSLEGALDFASKRNQMISNNIANSDTPFYKSKDVLFKTHLQKALDKQLDNKRTHQKHFKFSNVNAPFHVITNNHTTFNHNGNNVDMDKEMANLAKNQIYYQGVVDNINSKFHQLQSVIRGGR